MKRVYTAHDPTEAHLVKGLLEAEGIEAIVQGEHLFPLRGSLPVTSDTNPSVWVANDMDFNRGRTIAQAYDHGARADREGAPHWRCLRCGENLEGQFTACWKCGATRPPA